MIKYLSLIIFLFILMIVPAIATSGCCSSHGGVDCSLIQSNSKVVCNDGWLNSSCTYEGMVKCRAYTPKTYPKETLNIDSVYNEKYANQAVDNFNSKDDSKQDDSSFLIWTAIITFFLGGSYFKRRK